MSSHWASARGCLLVPTQWKDAVKEKITMDFLHWMPDEGKQNKGMGRLSQAAHSLSLAGLQQAARGGQQTFHSEAKFVL
jgi:hypothetical protein